MQVYTYNTVLIAMYTQFLPHPLQSASFAPHLLPMLHRFSPVHSSTNHVR